MTHETAFNYNTRAVCYFQLWSFSGTVYDCRSLARYTWIVCCTYCCCLLCVVMLVCVVCVGVTHEFYVFVYLYSDIQLPVFTVVFAYEITSQIMFVDWCAVYLPSKTLIVVEGQESLAVSAGLAGMDLSEEELLFGLCLRESSLSEWLYINMGMDSSPFPGQKGHNM
jgi:hypothetical protein